MATRRMFSREIVRSGAFTALPPRVQLLYYHLGMDADDDGVISNEKHAMIDAKASNKDFQALIDANFIMKAGRVYVIKHWRKNNYIQKDRYTPSSWQDDLNCLNVKPDGTYTASDEADYRAFLDAVAKR